MQGSTKQKKLSENQALKQIQLLVQRIQQSATRLSDEAGDKQQRIERARTDREYFNRTYLPHYFTCDSAEMHFVYDDEMQKPGPILIRWPRGFAKTTRMQGGMLHDFVYGIRKFQLVIGRTDEHAQEILTAIILELETNERLIQDFGDLTSDLWSWSSGFMGSNGCWLDCAGRGGRIRGVKKRQFRPDFIAADDIEDEELVRNPQRVKRLIKWWLGEVLGALEIGGTAVWLCTSLSSKSPTEILLDPKCDPLGDGEPPQMRRLSFKARNEDGESTWPGKWNEERLQAKSAEIGQTSFNREFMHVPELDDSLFRFEWFVPVTEKEIPKGLMMSLWCDPVAKRKVQATSKDTACVIIAGKDLESQDYYFLHVILRRITGFDLVKLFFDLHVQYAPRFWVVEMQTFAQLYDPIIMQVAKERSITPPLVKVEQKIPKEIRIQALQPFAQQRKFHYIKGHSDQDKLIEEFVYYPSGMPDDGPDTVALGEFYMRKMRRLSGEQKYKTAKPRMWKKGKGLF